MEQAAVEQCMLGSLVAGQHWCLRAILLELWAEGCSGFITVWWDPNAKCYRFLTCFRTPADAGCELRGTGHWDGDTFVNDYEEAINGKRTKMQDLWSDITPNSHTLTESHDAGDGVMKPYVVSHNTRQ
jgi:hypothetical protein